VFANWRLWDLEGIGVVGLWIFATLGVDFLYYWWHRWSHEVNLLWAAHIVHHHSEDYNLAVALRQAWFTSATVVPVYLPLALLGLPPHIYFISRALNTLYQFWIHTELVGKLGPVEWIMNTPSHHRVHHGVNEEYLDRNYAGIFIIWDRMFGTFALERARPIYGTTTLINSFNPVWANFHHFFAMASKSRELTGWRNKLRVWVAHPGWTPSRQLGGPESAELAWRRDHKFNIDATSLWTKGYIVVQLSLVIGALVYLLGSYKTMSTALALIAAALVVVTTVVWSGLLEGRRWAWPSEAARLACVGLLFYALLTPEHWAGALLVT
jgi:hypothetical protein